MNDKHIEKNEKLPYTEDDMSLGIRAVSDIVFKYIFGTEESVELLKAFINAVLVDAGYPPLREVKVVNPFNAKTYIDGKLSVIDTRAKDEAGNIYNVEVQVRSQADYQERSLYYWARAYADQLEEGHEYGTLHRVVSISILDFKLFEDRIPFHSCFMLRENGSPDYVLSQDLSMHYLETPKLKEEPVSEVEQWLYVLLHAGREDERMKVLIDQNEMLKKAMARYDYFAADEQARLVYEARQKYLHDQASFIANARREGLAEGLEEGRKKGREEGRAEGRAEGIQEGEERGQHKALEALADKLRDRGMSPEEIVEITGLPVKDI